MKARNFSVKLPEPIASYWTAANAGYVETAAACFAFDAVVHDEGHRHETPATIAAWIKETTRKYQPVVEPLHAKQDEARHLVTARVSGAFPGSPLELEYVFTLQNQKIIRLEIA